MNIWESAMKMTEEPGRLHPHVTMALDAIEEKAPECLGDTKQSRQLILALMDQAGFQVPVQNKVAGIIGLPKRGDTEDATRHVGI